MCEKTDRGLLRYMLLEVFCAGSFPKLGAIKGGNRKVEEKQRGATPKRTGAPGLEPAGPGADNTDPLIDAVLSKVYINMPWSSLRQFIGLVLGRRINIELGFSAVELESAASSDVIGAVALLRERGCALTAHGPFWDLCYGSLDPAIREVSRSRLTRLFELMEQVRPTHIICHTGFDPRHHRGHRKTWIDNSLSTWEFFTRRAEMLGTVLLLENVWEEDPEVHLALLDRIDSPWLGFCLDVGHQNAFSKMSLLSWLDATSGYLKEMHLHDNDGSFDHHLPPGRGNIDFETLFRCLGKKGLKPLLTLEPHTEEHLHESLVALSRMESFSDII